MYKKENIFALFFIVLSIAFGDDFGVNGKELLTKLSSDDYFERTSILKSVALYGESHALPQEITELLLLQYHKETDWRIKVRIILVLKYSDDKKSVLPFLAQCLNDREPCSGGSGQVPSAAAKVISEIGDVSTFEPLKRWVDFLKKLPYAEDVDEEYSKAMLKRNAGYLETLQARITEKSNGYNSPSSSAPEKPPESGVKSKADSGGK